MSVGTGVIWRFNFDGIALPRRVKPDNCWWFKKGRDDSQAIYQSDPVNGPPRGIRRTCYSLDTDVSLCDILKLDLPL
jgi:hypothetical protein